MARDELERGSDELRQASELVEGDTQERLYDQSNQLANLATREQPPDHGRLDRHMNTLQQIAMDLDGEAKEHVESAREAVRSYRETVEGV